MIKVLVLMPNLQGGGAERVVLDVVSSLNSRENNLRIDICLIKDIIDYSVSEQVSISSFYKLLEKDERLRFAIHKAIYKFLKIAIHYDIIIGGLELTPTYITTLAAKILNKKHIGWIHTDLPSYLVYQNKIHTFVCPLIYRFSKNLVFVSKSAKDRFENKILNSGKIKKTVIYNPINVEKILELSNETIEDNIPEDYLIYVGRLEYQKGVDILIKAYYEVVKSRPNIKTKLLIVGKGKEEDRLKNLTYSLGLGDRVVFLGFKENPYPYIKKSKLLILPSRLEGFPVVILEALALGKAVVASNCFSGPSEILENGKYGLLVEPENVKDLKNAILYLLNDKNRKIFEKRSRLRALEFNIESISSKWELFLNEVYNQ